MRCDEGYDVQGGMGVYQKTSVHLHFDVLATT
jgi:hypothetical protein